MPLSLARSGVEIFPNPNSPRPLSIDPSNNTVMSADGGGMTGMTIMGMAAGMQESGMAKDIKRGVGISSGASGIAALITDRAATDGRIVYHERLSGRQFINPTNPFQIADLGYLEFILTEGQHRIPATDLMASDTKFSFGVTNLSQFRPEVVRTDDPAITEENIVPWLMTAMTLPVLGGRARRHDPPSVEYQPREPGKQDLYCDGVTHASTPLLAMREALRDNPNASIDIIALSPKPVQEWKVVAAGIAIQAAWMRRQLKREGIELDAHAQYRRFSERQARHLRELWNGEFAPMVSLKVVAPPQEVGKDLAGLATTSKRKLDYSFEMGRWTVIEATNPGTEPMPVLEKRRVFSFCSPAPSLVPQPA